DAKGKKLVLPSLYEGEFLIPVSIAVGQNTVIITPIYPTVLINGKNLTVNADPIILNTSLVGYPTSIKLVDTDTTLEIENQNIYGFILNKYKNTVEVSDGSTIEYFEVEAPVDEISYQVELDEEIRTFEIL